MLLSSVLQLLCDSSALRHIIDISAPLIFLNFQISVTTISECTYFHEVYLTQTQNIIHGTIHISLTKCQNMANGNLLYSIQIYIYKQVYISEQIAYSALQYMIYESIEYLK